MLISRIFWKYTVEGLVELKVDNVYMIEYKLLQMVSESMWKLFDCIRGVCLFDHMEYNADFVSI